MKNNFLWLWIAIILNLSRKIIRKINNNIIINIWLLFLNLWEILNNLRNEINVFVIASYNFIQYNLIFGFELISYTANLSNFLLFQILFYFSGILIHIFVFVKHEKTVLE